MLLTASVFLPYVVTGVVVIAAVCYIFINAERRRALVATRYFVFVPAAGALLLAVPLVYRNYFGFLCGILFLLFLLLGLYVKSIATVPLLERFAAVCCAMSLVDAGAAIVEKIVSPGVRVVGLTYNPNFYAFLIEFVVIMAFYRLLTGGRRAFYGAVVVVNVVFLFLTDCRSAWAALFAGLLVLFVMLRKTKYLAGLGVCSAVFVAAVKYMPWLLPRILDFDRTTSIRMGIWKGAFADFLRHPLFGRGLLAYLQVSGDWITPHAHNVVLDLLECTGIVGTLLAAAYLTIVVVEIIRAFRGGGVPARAGCAVCLGCFAALLVHGLTDIPAMGAQTGLLFFLVLAMRPGTRIWSLPQKAAYETFPDESKRKS